LVLIGGIISLFGALLLLMVGIGFLFTDVYKLISIIYIVLSVLYIISGAFTLWAYKLMKNPMTLKKGSIIAIIFGVVGGFNLFTIIGGILGLTGDKK